VINVVKVHIGRMMVIVMRRQSYEGNNNAISKYPHSNKSAAAAKACTTTITATAITTL
jgi:hypothetical protein